MVTVDTKLIGLLGYPLRQTFAPQMFNETFRDLGMDYFYFPIEVREDRLATIVDAIRCMNFAGFNVTKPNKTAILDHLDRIDELAATIGSVNVVVVKDNVLEGHNTDGVGFVQSLLEVPGMDLRENTFLVLGAGGASRALSTTLAASGAKKLYIVDQADAASMSLADNINSAVRNCARFIPFEQAPVEDLIREVNVLVNATGVGMYPHTDRSPVDPALLHPDVFVIDITYNPAKTRLLLDAEERGCRTMNGLGMVIHQGVKGFSIMTGRPEPAEIMTRIMNDIVSQRK